jgi:hypothetical protein
MRTDSFGEIDLKTDLLGVIAEHLPKAVGTKDNIQKWLESKDYEIMVDEILELFDKHIDHAIECFKLDLLDKD